MNYRDMYFNDLVNIMVNNNFSQKKIDDVIDKNNLHNIRWEIYSAIESKILLDSQNLGVWHEIFYGCTVYTHTHVGYC